jgi:two-component system, NarL family, nitrate/nitrite response regulator NarL
MLATPLPVSAAYPSLSPGPVRLKAPIKEPIRVVIADQHPLFRDALGRTLRQDPAFELAGETGDPAALTDVIGRLAPTVAVVDAPLLEARFIDCCPSSTRVLALAAEVRPIDAYAAIEAGAAGYLSKDADAVRIRSAIIAVARGETILDPSAQTGIAEEIRLRARDERPQLSAREQEILVLIATGRTAPQIARDLHLGTATVKTHLLHVYEKLGVAERAAAVAAGMRRGLLE